MDIIRNGYGLPFTSIPQNCFIKSNKSALMHLKFVEDAIFKLLEDGCIQEVSFYYVLLTHSKKLQFSHVKIFSDNQGACRMTLVGSRKKHLQQLAVDIFALSVKYSFVIRTQ